MSEMKRVDYMAKNVRRKEQEIEVEEKEEDSETETNDLSVGEISEEENMPASRDVGGTKSIPGYKRSREMSLDKRLGVFGNKHGCVNSPDLLRQMAEKSGCYASPLSLGLTTKDRKLGGYAACHGATRAKSSGSPSTSRGCRSIPANQVRRMCRSHLAVRQTIDLEARPRGRPRKTPISKEVDNRRKRPGLHTLEPAPATPRVGAQPKTQFHRYVKVYTGRRVRQDSEFGVSDAKWQYYETSKLVLSAPGWVGNTCRTTCIPTTS
uniref:Uncharacterized protein n=1 Tax=Timema genevievae TaxID=629358 RepID=A0A7R9K056_TIMGE|nr:unnamed protein product [Timema genevievae]